MPDDVQNSGKIIIVSGNRNVGKTLFCISLKKALQDLKRPVAGVISPGLYQNGQKIGILAEDIATGERKLIARFNPGWDKQSPEKIWNFDLEGINWLNSRLKQVGYIDYLILDEIGYLELQQGRGWLAAIDLINGGNFKQAFVVIRPELLEVARNLWPKAEILIIKENDDPYLLIEKLLS